MLLTAGIFLIIKKWKNMEWLLAIILIIEVFLGIQVSAHYIYKVNQIEYKDLIIAEKILESNDGSETVTYLDEGSAPFVDFQQMQLGEIPDSCDPGRGFGAYGWAGRLFDCQIGFRAERSAGANL